MKLAEISRLLFTINIIAQLTKASINNLNKIKHLCRTKPKTKKQLQQTLKSENLNKQLEFFSEQLSLLIRLKRN